jgi:hypothetical protein
VGEDLNADRGSHNDTQAQPYSERERVIVCDSVSESERESVNEGE